jgi:C4-dicarboxylate transporter DctQ subunit
MKYPKFLEKINIFTGVVSGTLIIILGLLATMEGTLRGILSSPTSWSLDLSQYILIWTIFLGTSYAFQEKGHVSVDLVKEWVGGRWGDMALRVMNIIGYLMALTFILVIGWCSIKSFSAAVEFGKLTLGNFQIPLAYLYAAMVTGSLLMLITVVCIILDLIGGGKKYL